MALKSDSEIGVNSWLEDELYQQYLRDGSTVDESWKQVFAEPRPGNGGTAAQTAPMAKAAAAAPPAPSAPEPANGEQWQPLRGIAGKIAENMAASLAIPLATSQRTIA